MFGCLNSREKQFLSEIRVNFWEYNFSKEFEEFILLNGQEIIVENIDRINIVSPCKLVLDNLIQFI